MVKDRKVELRIPLEGLLTMGAAEDIVCDVEELIESEHAIGGNTVRPVGHQDLNKLSKMRNEITHGGAGYDLRVELELIASDAEE